MNALIAVVVAFLANGDMDYSAVVATDEADCRQKVAEIAHVRLDQSEQEEEVKVLGFSFECVELENKSAITDPNDTASVKPRHIPGNDEA